MGKKIFISHASDDKEIVSLFVDQILCAGSGVNIEDIIYTSREDSGVVNGDDIPSSIKDGIRQAVLFFMMVSEKYRESEVCLNEMGAAWMRDDLPKKILLIPGSGFDRIGWLMSLKKGTELTDSAGLDALHDQILDILPNRIQTATWNRSKEKFLHKLQDYNNRYSSDLDIIKVPEEDEMDLFDIRDMFDKHNQAFIDILNVLSAALLDYSGKVKEMTGKINKVVSNPKQFTPEQVRNIFKKGATETDRLSEVYEKNTPLLREHFDLSMKYAIQMQNTDISDEVKKSNREAGKLLLEQIVNARNSMVEFKGVLTSSVDIDKHFKKSKNRLIDANNQMLSVLAFCISRATEFQMS